MREVHACRLPLAEEPGLGFERALALVRSEVAGQVHVAPDALEGSEGTLAPNPGVALRWRLLTAPGVDDRLWTLRWQRPHEHDADLAWELGVDVALDGPRAWVDVRLALRPVGYRVLPVRFDPEPPALVGTCSTPWRWSKTAGT